MASMGRRMEIVVREDPEPPFFIHAARVRVDLGETILNAEMLHNRLNEEPISVAHNPQIAPGKIRDASNETIFRENRNRGKKT